QDAPAYPHRQCGGDQQVRAGPEHAPRGRPQDQEIDVLGRRRGPRYRGVYIGMNPTPAQGRVDQTGWLVAHSLAKSFGRAVVVRNVSLAVKRGEVVGLLGPNGAGKTTVFTMIMGLVKPDQGEI